MLVLLLVIVIVFSSFECEYDDEQEHEHDNAVERGGWPVCSSAFTRSSALRMCLECDELDCER